jgi:hypothetical protein
MEKCVFNQIYRVQSNILIRGPCVSTSVVVNRSSRVKIANTQFVHFYYLLFHYVSFLSEDYILLTWIDSDLVTKKIYFYGLVEVHTGCLNSKPDVLKCLCDLNSELLVV